MSAENRCILNICKEMQVYRSSENEFEKQGMTE
jgi:hypothetical protein